MVKYVYKCPECNKELEREFPMGEQPDRLESHCEETGKDVVCRRVWSSIPFIMK